MLLRFSSPYNKNYEQKEAMDNMFSKQQIKEQWFKTRQEHFETKGEMLKPDLHLTMIIAASSLFFQRQWNGDEYNWHPIEVGIMNTQSGRKKLIGFLHDVVEDSDWTLDDLREVGYDERIVQGIEAVTKLDEGKNYFDFVERCGLSVLKEVIYEGKSFWDRGSVLDGIETKMSDLDHNSQGVRSPGFKSQRQIDKGDAYNVSYYYLLGIKKYITQLRNDEAEAIIAGQAHPRDFVKDDNHVYPGMPIEDFMRREPYSGNQTRVKELLGTFSSRFNDAGEPLRSVAKRRFAKMAL